MEDGTEDLRLISYHPILASISQSPTANRNLSVVGFSMPRLFHGTSRTHADAMRGIPGQNGAIDVTRGAGEFGRGFYTQESVSNAHRRGYLTYGSRNGAVIVLDIDDVRYHALRFLRLGLNAAQQLNARLNGPARNTYVTMDDVIVGPLVSSPRIEQQKFQTQSAQNLLNGPHTHRIVI